MLLVHVSLLIVNYDKLRPQDKNYLHEVGDHHSGRAAAACCAVDQHAPCAQTMATLFKPICTGRGLCSPLQWHLIMSNDKHAWLSASMLQ